MTLGFDFGQPFDEARRNRPNPRGFLRCDRSEAGARLDAAGVLKGLEGRGCLEIEQVETEGKSEVLDMFFMSLLVMDLEDSNSFQSFFEMHDSATGLPVFVGSRFFGLDTTCLSENIVQPSTGHANMQLELLG